MKIKLILSLFALILNLNIISADIRYIMITNDTNTTLVVKQDGREIAFCRSTTTCTRQIDTSQPIVCFLGARKHRNIAEIIYLSAATVTLTATRNNSHHNFALIDNDNSSVSAASSDSE